MHVVLGYSVRSHSPASIAARRISNTQIYFPLGLVTFYFGKNPTFHAKTLRSAHRARPTISTKWAYRRRALGIAATGGLTSGFALPI